MGYNNLGRKAPKLGTTPAPSTIGQGTPADPSGAWPVEITDGTNILGTAANPLEVVVAEASDTGNVELARIRHIQEVASLREVDLERQGNRTRGLERVSMLTERGGR